MTARRDGSREAAGRARPRQLKNASVDTKPRETLRAPDVRRRRETWVTALLLSGLTHVFPERTLYTDTQARRNPAARFGGRMD